MNKDVIISCAVTGAGNTTGKSDKVPVTPQQIAASAIEAKAGELTIENDSLLVRVDKLTGGVAALVDKKSGVNFVPPGQPMASSSTWWSGRATCRRGAWPTRRRACFRCRSTRCA